MGNKKENDIRFNRFGTISFTATTRVNDFIDYLDKGMIAGTRCTSCQQTFFPPRADCCSCFSNDLEWFSVQGNGTLVTYSTLQYGPIGFEEDLPYTIAVLDYQTHRIFGRISANTAISDLHVGIAMAPRVEHLANGQLSYVFEKTT